MAAVDILMPVRDGRFVDPALASLRAQGFADFRMIVVQDGADDATRTRIASHAAEDPRIQLIDMPQSRGLAATLNFGLAACRAPLVARADADDVYHPERLGRQVAAFEARSALGVLSTNGRFIDEHGRVTGRLRQPVGEDVVAFRTMFLNPILHPGVMVRTEILRRVSGYDERFWTAQDSDLWARLSRQTRLDNLPQRLVDWRRHGGSVMATRGAEGEALSLSVPLRQQTAYLGGAPEPEDMRAAVETLRSWRILPPETLRRGTAHLACIAGVAQAREPRAVLRDFHRLTARGLARQAGWLVRSRPAEAAWLTGLALRWRAGLANVGTSPGPRGDGDGIS